MCNIFVSQDPATYQAETRAIRLHGHCTSIRLEAAFWATLEEIATKEGLGLARFVAVLHDEITDRLGDVPDFASFLRVTCLHYLRLLAITSPDRLHAGWLQAQKSRRNGDRTAHSHIEKILSPLAPNAALVTVLDGHPATHSWLGAVRGQRIIPLGPDHFGQSGDIPDLYREYGMDTDAILDACAQALIAV